MTNTPKKLHTSTIAILTAGIILACFVLGLVVIAFLLPSQFDGTFVGELKYKLERLENSNGKKIVIVGGSAAAFGLKSDYIAKYFPDYTIVNFGMYADLGTSVMLDLAKANVKEGDIYVICPEQDEQTLSTYYNAESFWQAADGAFDMLGKISPDKAEATAAAFISFAGKKLNGFINGGITVDGIYNRSSFNEYGDIESDLRPYNVMSLGYNPEQSISLDKSVISSEFIDELNEFSKLCWEKGAKAFYHFPPMNGTAVVDSSTQAVDDYFDYLQSQLKFTVIGDPHKSIMDEGWFFDTNFHLNDSGAYHFTKTFIEHLKLALLIDGEVEIPLPTMPRNPDFEFFGDDSDANLFTFVENERGVVITGLTEEGKLKGELIIPSHIAGKAVVDYDQSAFKGNKTLEKLTIQPNVGMLYDGTFEGCDSLTAIIFTSNTPSSYAVGDNFLKGTNALIYVPNESLASYLHDYSWKDYSSKIQAISAE